MYDTHTIQNEKSILGINPQGGYVTSWNDHLYIGSSIRRTGIPILFPYYGKSHHARMHGIGRDSLWRVINHVSDSVTMELTTQDVGENTSEYSYDFNTTIHVQLESTESFIYTLKIINNDSKDIPVSPGLHPYWQIPHTEKSGIKIEGLPDFDARKFDWNNSPPDNPYPFSGKITASLSNKKLTIEELSPVKQVKYIQIWSQTPLRDPDFDFICIEPICGLNYAIDEAPIKIHPGQTWEMKVRFSISSEKP